MITLLGLDADAPAAATAPSTPLNREIDGFLLRSPSPTSADVANFLKLYSGAARTTAAQALIARGIPAATISSALNFLETSGKLTKNSVIGMLSFVSAGACAYHGLKRHNGSLAWGAWWMLMGGIFPVFAPLVAIVRSPGFAKPLPK